MWKLRTNLDGRFAQSAHQTEAEAIEYRDKLLQPSYRRIDGFWHAFYPQGWTAITLIKN